MSFEILIIEDTQRFLGVVIVYKNKIYGFQFALQKRPEGFSYLYPGAKEKIPPANSIEVCLTTWPKNLKRIDYEKAHLMINPSRDRYDVPQLRFIDELYIRGYPQADYELAMNQAIRWSKGVLVSAFTGEDFDVDNLEKEIEFDGVVEWFQIV